MKTRIHKSFGSDVTVTVTEENATKLEKVGIIEYDAYGRYFISDDHQVNADGILTTLKALE